MTNLRKLVPTTVVGVLALVGGYALALRSNPSVEAAPALGADIHDRQNEPGAADTAPARSGSVIGSEVNAEIRIPARQSAKAAPPIQIPAVPDACDRAPSLTLEVVVHTGAGPDLRKTITRTATRVHVKFGESAKGPEWLLIRNPVVPTRVDATLVNHSHEAILEYDDTALRNMGIATGWAEVVALGVNPNSLTEAKGPPAERRLSNVSFANFALEEAGASAETLWWSDSACLPLSVSKKLASAQTSTITSISERIDAELLKDPRSRYPTYQSVEAIDWLEKHHDEGHESH